MNIDIQPKSRPNRANQHKEQVEYLSQSKGLNFSDLASPSHDEGGLNLDQIVETLQRRRWIIFGVTTLCISLTGLWNRTRPPAYEGIFRILIEPVTAESQVVSAVTGKSTTPENQDLGGNQTSNITLDYPTQIQILLSEKILLPVVYKLKSNYPETSYDSLKSSLDISRIKEPTETKILQVNYRSASSSEAQQVVNIVSQAYIHYSLNERQTNVRRAISFLDSQLPNAQSQVRNFELALQNFRVQNQLIDPITLGTQLGTQMANTQQELLTTQIELEKSRQLYRSLEQQLQLHPKSAEAASVLSEAPEYQALVKQLQELDIELQSQSAELSDNHPKILSLRQKREKLLPLLRQKASAVLGNNLSQNITNPQALPYQNALRQDLSKQFIASAIQVQVLQAKLGGLNTARQALARQTSQLPNISRQYENLQRQLQIATDQLSKFLQKRQELMINAARQEVPWELIAAPSVKKVSSSSLVRDLILGSILGFLLGTGVALLLEKINNVIFSIKALREEIRIPILGMIPRQENEQKRTHIFDNFMDKETDTTIEETREISTKVYYRFKPFIESFRALNSQIRLLRPDAPIQSLVVSSSLPGEGKTTIAIHLAQAAAAMGQRVLLVDADLRNPSLQNLLTQNYENNFVHGLTDVIMGSYQLLDVIQPLNEQDNLYLLSAGSISLDPTNILSSRKMQDLIEHCQNNFDLVIYDTIPLSFADPLLLIPQTDGLLMIATLGKVNRVDLRNSLRTLDTSNVSVLGLVVNMIEDRQSSGGAYY